MRLVVQIPCFNEAATVGAVVSQIPRQIPGIDAVVVLVVDDGSTDGTAALALAAGADYVARHARNRGLAAAFRTGVDAALQLGADIVVNIDGDDQYPGAAIPALIEPIVAGRADVVVGDRQPGTLVHFSPQKRFLQLFGSWVVRQFSGTPIPDAPSGFRAFSREAALRLNVVTSYSYTLETLIQAGAQRLAVSSVPIRVRPTERRSRLARSTLHYVQRSMATILRVYTMYQPLKVFLLLGAIALLPGLAVVARFLWFAANGQGAGHVQSLVLAIGLIVLGIQLGTIGLVADLIAANRRLMEESLYHLRKLDANPSGVKTRADGDEAPADRRPEDPPTGTLKVRHGRSV